MFVNHNNLICYKETLLSDTDKLQFFLDKHSTKEGTWGLLKINSGEIDFIFVDGEGLELSKQRLNQSNSQIWIPPASWHKIKLVYLTFTATLGFYCQTHRYFNKKYKLGNVHSDLNNFYNNYLQQQENLNILDVGCGSGRNLLYLALNGNKVTGLDSNQTALDKTMDVSNKELMTDVILNYCDLNQTLSIKNITYDVIISTVCLQFLEKSRIPSLLLELGQATKVGGLHFLVFPLRSDVYSLPESFTYLPKSKELYNYYQDQGWSILEYKESVGMIHRTEKSGRQIQGMFALLVAQKI